MPRDMPRDMARDTGWRASNRYWRKTGVVIVAVCVIVPFFTAPSSGIAAPAIVLALALPVVAWTWRLAAWDDGSQLVIRSWFRTKRIPWADVVGLTFVERGWGHSWVTAAVRYADRRTYINCMVAVSDPGVRRLRQELRVVADRHGITVDDAPDAHFRPQDSIGGLSIWD